MKNNRKGLLLMAAVLFFTQIYSQQIFADALMQRNSTGATGNQRSNDTALLNQNNSPIPQAVNPQLVSTGGLQQNGQNAAKQQNGAMMAGLASAAFSTMIAGMTCGKPGQEATCMAATLGALAGLAAAMMMKKAADKSNAQVAATTIGGTPVTTPSPQPREMVETSKKLATIAKNVGSNVDIGNGKLKTKDGREIKLSDLGSATSMAKAGMKPSEIKAFGDIMKEGNKKADAAMKAADGDPNAGGSEGGGTQVVMSDAPAGGVSKGSDVARAPGSVPGATRDFNGTPIGVSVENIFVMMNRRYAHEAETKKLTN